MSSITIFSLAPFLKICNLVTNLLYVKSRGSLSYHLSCIQITSTNSLGQFACMLHRFVKFAKDYIITGIQIGKGIGFSLKNHNLTGFWRLRVVLAFCGSGYVSGFSTHSTNFLILTLLFPMAGLPTVVTLKIRVGLNLVLMIYSAF